MKLWMHNVDIDTLNAIGKNTLSEHLGMQFTEVGEDYLIATMPVDHRTKQPAGLLHGGASIAFAETLGSVASNLCVDFTKKSVVGLEINGNHLKAVKEGIVTGKVSPIKIGKTIHVWQIEIFDENEKIVNRTRLTVMILDQKSA